MTEFDPALIEKAAHVIGFQIHPYSCDGVTCRDLARAVLDAVAGDIEAKALRDAAADVATQAPGDPNGPEDIAYYDGHMAAVRVLRERADQINPKEASDGR